MKSNDAAKHVFYSEMAKLLEAGFGFIAVGSDLSTVSSGTRQLLGAFGRG